MYSGFEYARAQNLEKLLIWEGYTEDRITLNKPEYASIMSQKALICLNNAEYAWICIYPIKRVLNMPEFWIQNAECI